MCMCFSLLKKMEEDEQPIKSYNREYKFSFTTSLSHKKWREDSFCTHLGNNQNECVKTFGLKASMNIGVQ